MTELWKPIPGYEGYYEASNTGKVRSVSRDIVKSTGVVMHHKGKTLTPQLRANYHKAKYWVNLTVNGKAYSHILARLIARTWCDGYKEGLTVDHVDGNCLNNNASNLEWVTWQENLSRGYRKGIMKQISVVLESEEGLQHSFVSRRDASKFLGRHPQYLSSMIRSNCLFAYSTDGTKYKIIKGREKLHA